MRALAAFLALALAPAARAATIVGGDYAGTDLTPANGDVLSGTFLNVRLFSLPAGATVYVDVGAKLAVYATTASIAGTLDASGRGRLGGGGGAVGGAGLTGFGDGASSAGSGGAAAKGGGGGAYGGNGGAGAGTGGGSGGSLFDSTGVVTAPISADDVFMGSGGGGGGGGFVPGGAGGAGGGAVFIEAASMTVTGAVLLDGATAPAAANSGLGTNPAGGGGGSGGGLVLRVTGVLQAARTRFSANGGNGGDVLDLNTRTLDVGGGGSGGRIKVFARSASFASVVFSTAGGAVGGSAGFGGAIDTPSPAAGGAGSVSFGVVASSPTSLSAQAVYVTSVSWAWSATPSFGDAPAASQAYRLFPSTAAAPLTAPMATASALATGTTETGLTPNTTYWRVVTAFTDWGDSFPSVAASTHTLAAAPASAGFTALGATGLTVAWTQGSPSNPSYTQYETQGALDSGFATGLMDSFATAQSSSPAGLTPNTTYWFRTRAVNIDGVPTAFTPSSATATLAQAPASPAVGPVNVTSASFAWSGGANPAGTQYAAEVSSDNFFSLTGSSVTLMTSATFFALSPGTQYYFRARAVNRAGLASAYSTTVSTTAGVLTDVSPPSAPGAPVSDRRFSYDGTVVFLWSPALSSVGILDYDLLIGTFAGGNDVFNGVVAAASYTATGLASGKTYYAEVRARSNAGVVGPFSGVSVGVPVYRTATEPPIAAPFAWPNPFDPARGPVQIGFSLSAPADVTFKIYSLNGRLLREVTQSFSSAGNQVGSWDGADSSGRRAAPGGYVVAVRKNYSSGSETQKVKVAVLY